MASVDDRIVRMQFDNAAFEKKISSTLASLGQLDKALKFTGATKGLADVSQAADKLHFGSISDGIENVSKKFIALSTVAITVLSDITTRAVQAGAQLIKSFAIKPVLDGFHEYETNMNSIQTILANTASKGTTLDQVTAALDKLNTYSDKTIYNFGEMAKNIGTFTAAGVDLDTSVNSIKGIANLAAMSGSSADQASTAMYQLSQAIASGSLKLMDWNSVVNAGMGGEAFKSALFETGKAMKTLKGIPMEQTFKQWSDAGNSFRDSLQDGWITSDVLTTTLSAFTGDMTEEMLLQKGFSQAQATAILKTAATAQAAATEVKTFSQLVGTVREAVGTGWADSFRIIIGNFTEAKALWTGVNNSIGTFISKNADARNALLAGWAAFGGRLVLIQSFQIAFKNLGEIIAPIREAFRTIFPPITVKTLLEMTLAFKNFAEALKPSETTVNNIRRIFTGLFAILSIGWTVIKEGVKFFYELVGSMLGFGGPSVVNAVATVADFFTALQEFLVKGGGIKNFFNDLREAIKSPLPFLEKIGEFIGNLFTGFDKDTAGKVEDSVGRIGDRFESLRKIFDRLGDIWRPIQEAMPKILHVLDVIWNAISGFFEELGSRIAEIIGSGNFDEALDALNVALLGGIAALLAKFIKSGFTFDIGGGMFEKIGKSFEQLTGVLKSMQTKIKAEALMKIAIAIGILTASVIALSLIDSAALTKSLTAMAAGFAQLMASFAIISRMNTGPSSAASFSLVATGMILLSTAILILAGAIRVLATLSPEELATGLYGIGVSIALMVGSAIILSKNAADIFIASAALVAMSIALTIMAGAVKLFSLIDIGATAQGLIAISASLVLIGLSMRLMPDNLFVTAAGLVLIGVALNFIARAMTSMSKLSWEDIAKGIVGIGAGLLVIAGAMRLMPDDIFVTTARLLLISIAINVMAKAMKIMGGMSWGEIAKGITSIALVLIILAGAMYLMQSTLAGAAAIGIAAASLLLLATVLNVFADLSYGDLLHGLVAVAIALGVIGLAAFALQGAIPYIFALGIALLALGGGFALIGIGAFLLAKALEAVAASGVKGAKAIGEILKEVGKAIPAIAIGFAEGVIEFATLIGDAAPKIMEAVGKLLDALLDQIMKLIPKLGKILSELIVTGLAVIRSYAAEYIKTGLFIIVTLLTGIRDNIGKVASLAIEIVVNFINAIATHIDDIVGAGLNLLLAFISGIVENVVHIVDAVGEIITSFIGALVNLYTDIIQAGADALVQFLYGITSNITKVAWAAVAIIISMINSFTSMALTIAQAGTDALIAFLKGITDNALKIAWTAVWIITTLMSAAGQMVQFIIDTAVAVILTFLDGLAQNAQKLIDGGIAFLRKLLEGIAKGLVELAGACLDIVIEFNKQLRKKIDEKMPELRESGRLLLGAIINGMTMGLAGKMEEVGEKFAKGIGGVVSAGKKKLLVVGDPYSKVTMGIGEAMMNGMAMALDADTTVEDSAVGVVGRAAEVFTNSLATISERLGSMEEFNPVITPVLDLTQVAADANKISDYIQTSQALAPSYSLNQARTIAASANAQQDISPVNAPGDGSPVKFEQNIYAPTQLSTSDIYKQTRNQITMAKEELSIP